MASNSEKPSALTPFDILQTAAQQIDARAAIRDLPQGERSMARCVAIFNAATGRDLSEGEGWLFMQALKIARSLQGELHIDDYIDEAAYGALRCEYEQRAKAAKAKPA